MRNKKTNNYKILLLYGYHPKETFAISVAEELKKFDLPNTKIVKYDGEPDTVSNDLRYFKQRRFVKQFLPFDYLVDLHDSPDAVDTETYISPATGFMYLSKKTIPKERKYHLFDFARNWEDSISKKGSLAIFIDPEHDMSSTYDILSTELFGHYVTKDNAVDYLKKLVKTLNSSPRYTL